MQGRYQHILAGAAMTLLVLAGVWAVLSSQTRAELPLANAAAAVVKGEDVPGESTPLRHPPIIESASTNNSRTDRGEQVIAGAGLPAEASVAEPGAIDNPLTDKDIILVRVAEFVRRQEQLLLGREGWLRVAQTIVSSESAEGDYYQRETDELIPVAMLIPENPTFETWYHVDETGAYIEGMGLVIAQDGTVHQQTILVDGNWLNLTLRGPDAYRRKQYRNTTWVDEPFLSGAVTLNALEQESTWPNVTWQAYSAGGQFILITEQHYDSPVSVDDFTEELIMGVRDVYTFDEASGRLLSREISYLPGDGSSSLREMHHSLAEEFVAQLPAEALRLFDDAVSRVAESR